MSLIISNFARRVADYAKQNRARLIKWLVILAACLLGALLIYYGVEEFHAWRFAKKVEAIDKRIGERESEIKAAEAVIYALKTEIAAKDALLEELDNQASAAKVVYVKSKAEVVYLKEKYEDTRTAPDIPACVSYADACAELARLGFQCR